MDTNSKGTANISKKKHFQDGIVSVIINKIADTIMNIVNRVEMVKGKSLELVAVTGYCIAHMLMLLVHEPWFDETLAWLIARDSSIYEILFVAPHFEGHPSLWHLVLVPFAKLGAPFELSLSLVSLLFSGLAMALFVYKAPFKRIIRLLMPFTYYLFFQYSVVSRPYCMLMLAFVLMAITFKNRNEKPGRFVLAIWFSCISSVYGIVIGGGICIVWLIEMFMAANVTSKNKSSENGESRGAIKIFFQDHLFKNGKIIWLAGLLIYALFILYRVNPSESAYAVLRLNKIDADNGFVIRILYTCFGMLSDLFFTNVLYTTNTLRAAEIIYSELAVAVLIGAGMMVCFLMYGKKKLTNILYFLIPYVLLSIFAAVVYLYYHHVGILLLFILFWIWTSKIDDSLNISKTELMDSNQPQNKKIYKSFMIIAVSFMIGTPLYWSITSCIFDVNNSFGSGRKTYEFLEKNDLDKGYKILADWGRLFKRDKVPEDYFEYAILFSQKGVSIEPYLKNDTIINSPAIMGKSYAYMHEIPNKDQTRVIIEKIKKEGLPDIIIGAPELIEGLGKEYINFNDYVLVYENFYGNITKGVAKGVITYIYLRKELAKERGLEKIDLTIIE